MKKSVSLFFLFPLMLVAQERAGRMNVPRDTSFTVFSAAQSVQKHYPFARLVFPENHPGLIVSENLVYSSYGDRQLHLDIFRPPGKSEHPAVLLIHGGGWRTGQRSQGVPMAQVLAANGYVAVTVEYRLSIEAFYPAAVYDLKAAVRWLRANASDYLIDSTKIAVLGCSAGGQLAALLGTTNDDRKFEGDGGNISHSSAVQAIVDIDGILDFTDPAESGKDTLGAKPSAGKYWFGKSFKEKPDLWIEASPLVHVGKQTAPIGFINSSLERFHAGRDAMIAKLNMLGIYSEVHTIPDTPHPFWFFHPWFGPTCMYTINFLDKVFATKPENNK